jgi:predicted dehydrogenase
MEKSKIVVVGWGRMGITHTAILGGLYPDGFDVQVVENNKIVRKVLSSTLGYTCFADINQVSFHNAKVLITTPPAFHSSLVKTAIENGAESVFVEKPFGLSASRVQDNDIISVGYVLRFSEIAQEIKRIIDQEGCLSLSLNYSSNTLTKKPKGWRNGLHGGVLNEMGSHLLDMMLYLLSGETIEILSQSQKSVISDVDDIISFTGSCGDSKVSLNLNWVDQNVRKPVWSGKLLTKEREIIFDMQSISSGYELCSVDYYVRGRDFSLQMKHFIEGNKNILCSSVQANRVHDFISKFKLNESIIR